MQIHTQHVTVKGWVVRKIKSHNCISHGVLTILTSSFNFSSKYYQFSTTIPIIHVIYTSILCSWCNQYVTCYDKQRDREKIASFFLQFTIYAKIFMHIIKLHKRSH